MAKRTLVIFSVFIVLAGCDQQGRDAYAPTFSDNPQFSQTEYVIGVHPLHNPQRLHEIFAPLANYLSERIDKARFRIEASRSYADYDKKLYDGKFDFALPNPYQTVQSLKHGYHVIGKMGDDFAFRGIYLVRKDSGIQNVTDLKGKKVAYPAPTALAATMMPQYYLYQNGLNISQDIQIQYVGSQESSIMSVYLGNVSASATWPPPWKLLSKERPELEKALKVIWETKPLLNNGFVAKSTLPPKLAGQVADELAALHQDPTGRKILESMHLSKFEKANDETYAPVESFLRDFSQSVRALE